MIEPGARSLADELTNLAAASLEPEQINIFRAVISYLLADLARGHSCSELAKMAHELKLSSTQIHSVLVASQMVACYSQRPQQLLAKPLSWLAIGGGELLYLSRYLAYELSIVRQVEHLAALPVNYSIDKYNLAMEQLQMLAHMTNQPNSEQLAAIQHSAKQVFSIITGGPGTGKTTTVTLLLWLYYQLYGPNLQVKICAPTGKAAVRVRESVLNSLQRLHQLAQGQLDVQALQQLVSDNSNFLTLHKLLGYKKNSIYFQRGPRHPLALEVLIVDESSMVGLPLFSKLIAALELSSLRHLVLLGDRNQLSSVEEGYVFASLVTMEQQIADFTSYDLFASHSWRLACELTISNRNQGEVHALAQAILAGIPEAVLAILERAPNLSLLPPQLANLLDMVVHSGENSWLTFIDKVTAAPDLAGHDLLQCYTQQAVLCLTNSGVLGSDNLNRQIERHIRIARGITSEWYAGRPLIILKNDYNLEVFNGDIGICQIREGNPVIVFADNRQFIPELLPEYGLAYAITIHKSQGSEYQLVNVVLPADNWNEKINELLNRELIYTAITRACQSVRIFAKRELLSQALLSITRRSSGLCQLLQ